VALQHEEGAAMSGRFVVSIEVKGVEEVGPWEKSASKIAPTLVCEAYAQGSGLGNGQSIWCWCSLTDVSRALESSGVKSIQLKANISFTVVNRKIRQSCIEKMKRKAK
jgi:hypothetical protein